MNYNETPEQLDTTLDGYNDWLNLDLRQGASRRNRSPGDVTINSVEVPIAWSLEIDKDDVASGDPGFGDPRFGEITEQNQPRRIAEINGNLLTFPVRHRRTM